MSSITYNDSLTDKEDFMLNQQDQQAISYAQTAIMQDIQSKQNINPLRQAFTAQ